MDDTSGGFVNAFSVMNSSETEIVRIGQYSNAGIVESKVGALKLCRRQRYKRNNSGRPIEHDACHDKHTRWGERKYGGGGILRLGYGAFWVVGSNTGLPVAVLAVPSGQTANILQWVTSSNSAGLGTIAGVINSNGSVGIGTDVAAFLPQRRRKSRARHLRRRREHSRRAEQRVDRERLRRDRDDKPDYCARCQWCGQLHNYNN